MANVPRATGTRTPTMHCLVWLGIFAATALPLFWRRPLFFCRFLFLMFLPVEEFLVGQLLGNFLVGLALNLLRLVRGWCRRDNVTSRYRRGSSMARMVGFPLAPLHNFVVNVVEIGRASSFSSTGRTSPTNLIVGDPSSLYSGKNGKRSLLGSNNGSFLLFV